MKDLKKALMQRMLGAELTGRRGYEHGHEPPPAQTNRRNGVGGKVELAIPRDRQASFDPQLIAT